MKAYYLIAEESAIPGEHRIIAAHYDSQDFAQDITSFGPNAILEIDEIGTMNRTLCADLKATVGRLGTDPPATAKVRKYFVKIEGVPPGPVLYRRDGWKPLPVVPSRLKIPG